MNILIFLLISILWVAYLFYSFRNSFNKIAILVIGFFFQIVGAFLIFQDGVKADEQIITGNVFGNSIALFLMGGGFMVFIVLTILIFRKKIRAA